MHASRMAAMLEPENAIAEDILSLLLLIEIGSRKKVKSPENGKEKEQWMSELNIYDAKKLRV
jgi:hypothetical protein